MPDWPVNDDEDVNVAPEGDGADDEESSEGVGEDDD
jgi:hypothetical protein